MNDDAGKQSKPVSLQLNEPRYWVVATDNPDSTPSSETDLLLPFVSRHLIQLPE